MTITWSSTSTLLEISAFGVTKATTLALLADELGVDAGGRGRLRRHAQRPADAGLGRDVVRHGQRARQRARAPSTTSPRATTRTGSPEVLAGLFDLDLLGFFRAPPPPDALLAARADGARGARGGRPGAATPPKPHKKAPACPAGDRRDSSKAAMAVFSGVVTDVQRSPADRRAAGCDLHPDRHRRPGLPGQDQHGDGEGADRPQPGRVQPGRPRDGHRVHVLRHRLRRALDGRRHQRHPDHQRDRRRAGGRLLGEGEPPIEPPPETAVFTPVDTSEPQSLSRSAAPGAALVLVGLLGLSSCAA